MASPPAAPKLVFFASALAVLLPTVASATDFVLTPLVSDSTVTAKQKLAVHQLMASELGFAPEVEELYDLAAAPPSLNDACLLSVRCLSGIAQANRATAVVTGKMSGGSGKYTLDLVFYKDGAIVRRLKFTPSQDATQLANAMTPIIRELLTGDSPLDDADETPSADDFADEEDIALAPTAPATRKPAPAAPRPAPGAPRPAAPALPVGEYTADELNLLIRFGSPTGPPKPAPAPVAAATPAPTLPPVVEEPRGPVGKETHTRVRSSDRPAGVPPVEKPHPFGVTARGGYSTYGVFDFLTAGGEVTIGLGNHVHVLAGAEVFAVRRKPPEALVLAQGVVAKWDFIYPLNVGVLYKFPIGHLQPYLGADFIGVRYYHDDIGSDWAGGGRLRGGVDWMASQNFGFNVNAAAGVWTGGNWSLIEEGLKTTGFLPQVSAGTVFVF